MEKNVAQTAMFLDKYILKVSSAIQHRYFVGKCAVFFIYEVLELLLQCEAKIIPYFDINVSILVLPSSV